MGIKRVVRENLEKIIGKFGYTIVKKHKDIKQMRLILQGLPKETSFDEDAFRQRDSDRYVVSWVVPLLGPGSGGHLDIFRAIHFLTDMGIKNRVYIYGGDERVPSADLQRTVKEFYGFDIQEDEIYPSANMMTYTDAVIATSWQTAYAVRAYENTVSKFYFVQDFEPYFYPVGSEYAFAENTYKFGFRGITAGDWLAEKLRDEYGMETQAFHFSYERELYRPKEKKDKKNRVFFYARPYTERRAFEMGVLALERLAGQISDLEVMCAGQRLDDYEYKFDYRDLGILPLDALCDVYSQCDLCLVLSMTNLSLLPMEIMASNSVVVSNRGENNTWMLNEDNAILVDNDPVSIADTMAYFLRHKEELASKRKRALEFVNAFTWEDEIRKVHDFIVASIQADMDRIKK